MNNNDAVNQSKHYKLKRRRRVVSWTLAVLLLTMLLAPLSGYLLTDRAVAQQNTAGQPADSGQAGAAAGQTAAEQTAAEQTADEQTAAGQTAAEQTADEQTNERSNFWRAVREGNTGYSAVKGQESNVLIQGGGENELGIPVGGENWRAIRNGPLATYGGWIFAGVLVLLVLAFILFGRVRLEHGRAGYTVDRWGMFDRTLHWFTAISFITLAVTGLSLLYGRSMMIPVMGKDAFAAYAIFAKDLHNYLGPFFAVSLTLQLLKWMRHNFPTWTDIVWFFKGGGMLGSIHPHAGRMNGGEKVWYWILFFGGIVLIGSGFILDFPGQIAWYGQTRAEMQVAHLFHASSAIVLIAVALGHIYIGTIGTEGALEGMTTGRVDTAWAKQHHDLWYQQLMEEGVQPDKTPDVTASSQATPRTT